MISYVALDRIVEQRRRTDRAYRRQVAGRPMRSSTKDWTDEALLAKLAEFGVDYDRPTLARLAGRHLSAEEISRPFEERYEASADRAGTQVDWIWVCLTELWLRWLPDEPSFERLDDRMQTGYDLLHRRRPQPLDGCRIWLQAWADVLALMDKGDVHTVAAFDRRFRGSQSLFNWLGDLEIRLWDSAPLEPTLHRGRVDVCRTALDRFTDLDGLMTENLRRALAESSFELGEAARVDTLYEAWLQADPRWGWGWIAWSDCYDETATEARDEARAEQLLRRGLAVQGVRDRHYIAERLADLYERQGRTAETRRTHGQAQTPKATVDADVALLQPDVLRAPTTLTFGNEGLPLDALRSQAPTAGRRKIGRNEPCPCGSGLKYKKCCGR